MTPGHLTAPRVAGIAGALLVAIVIQTSVLPHFAVRGVVADAVLLVVVAVGLRHGAEPAMVLGFTAGLLLDLMPAADHVVGRWALALLAAGYLSGALAASGPVSSVRSALEQRRRWLLPLATVAACSFVASSVFALSGLVLRDPLVGVADLLEVVLIALISDVVLGLLVVPFVFALDERLEPDRLVA
ncbi:rod shape-determining protein MreD [Nocardioides sp.]|uniref:rod shape-determining protein MreD n=1 Tax=Nocardioides sp. TaxID=35761 RepID=UPI0035674BF6